MSQPNEPERPLFDEASMKSAGEINASATRSDPSPHNSA